MPTEIDPRCVGCRLGFPLNQNGFHEDGAGGIKHGPSRPITQEEREYIAAMIRAGFVSTDPTEGDDEREN